MSKKVGKIVNDYACFMKVSFSANIFTGVIDVEVDYDKRIIKSKDELEKVTNQYFRKVEKILNKDLGDSNE